MKHSLALLTLLCGLMHGANAASDADQVLATYDGGTIQKSVAEAKLRQYYDGKLPDNKNSFTELPLQFQEAFINNMIIETLVDKKVAEQKLADDPRAKMRMAEMQKQVLYHEHLQRVLDAALTEEALKERYSLYIKNWEGKKEMHARHILLKDETTAKEAIQRIKKGESFESVATAMSQDSTKENGGDLGYFQQGQMIKEFEEAAMALKKGEISKPIQTGFGWHVIKLEDSRAVKVPSFEEIRNRLEEEMRQEVLENYFKSILAGVHAKLHLQAEGATVSEEEAVPSPAKAK